MHIAIDFGTDGCGLAFAYDGNVTTYERFKARRQRTNKTKTHILLNHDNKVVSFGNNAKFCYSELDDKQTTSWKFFERFKMALYDDKLRHDTLIDAHDEKKNEGVDISKYLKAANGASLGSEKVFVLALQQLGKLAKEFIPRITKDDINSDEIQWILTVPAIWSENAKMQMKKWVFKAGLADEYIKDQCVIVYEPDAASLQLQKEYFKNDACESFVPDDKYILIDAGGGTVDIACHKVCGDGRVEEIIYPTGGPYGSCYIDDAYMKLLENIFSKKWLDEFKQDSPTVYVDIIYHFQQAKTTFYENSEALVHNIQLPFEFLQFLEEKCGANDTTPEIKIKSFSKSTKYFRQLFSESDEKINESDEKEKCVLQLFTKNENKKYKDSEDHLEMDVKIWKCLFDSKINPIISHVSKLSRMKSLKNQCKYLCLVGGFSGSLYFRQRMQQAFGMKSTHKLTLIIPQKPILSIVQGAAWMGITKNYVKARKLRYTYGINMYFEPRTAKNVGISDKYIKNNISKDGLVKNCFKIVARKNERVEANEVKETTGYRRSKTSLIQILYSNQQNPKTQDDGFIMAALTVPHFGENKQVITEFHFYGTTFRVSAYPKTNKALRKEVEITYAK